MELRCVTSRRGTARTRSDACRGARYESTDSVDRSARRMTYCWKNKYAVARMVAGKGLLLIVEPGHVRRCFSWFADSPIPGPETKGKNFWKKRFCSGQITRSGGPILRLSKTLFFCGSRCTEALFLSPLFSHLQIWRLFVRTLRICVSTGHHQRKMTRL